MFVLYYISNISTGVKQAYYVMQQSPCHNTFDMLHPVFCGHPGKGIRTLISSLGRENVLLAFEQEWQNICVVYKLLLYTHSESNMKHMRDVFVPSNKILYLHDRGYGGSCAEFNCEYHVASCKIIVAQSLGGCLVWQLALPRSGLNIQWS